MNKSSYHIILCGFAGGLFGFLGAYFTLTPKVNALSEDITLRPPVIVVDMAKLAMDTVPVGSSPSDIRRHFTQVQGVIDKFSDAGFLVLSRENIISAPSDLVLSSQDLASADVMPESTAHE